MMELWSLTRGAKMRAASKNFQVNNYISSKQLYFIFGILHFNQNILDKYQYSK